PNTVDYPLDTKFGAGVISGFGINFPITKKWEISTEINYSKKRFSTSENIFEFAKVDFIEKQKWIEFPLYCRYSFGGLKLAPYVLSGITLSRLLDSKGYLSRDYIYVDSNYRKISSMSSLINHRKKYNFSLTIGIGAEYYINQDYLFFDFRYDHGLINIVNTNKRFSEAIFIYYYLDNDFRITNMIFTFGYKKSIFRRKPIINKNVP
ncbi:MAG: PorT family protein, partial [Candidatus Lokiarchaeota archaeon]|nr:PorT family protein [Candidatus Lokiarchaeota archaeon]